MPTREIVEIDDAAFPLIVVEMPEALDARAIDAMFAAFDRVLERKARFATLIDTRPLRRFPDALARKRIADWMTLRVAAEALYNLGNALVIQSVAARASITAINWLRRPVNPQSVFAARWEAVDWCCARLVAAGIGLTGPILARRAQEHALAGRVPGPIGTSRATD